MSQNKTTELDENELLNDPLVEDEDETQNDNIFDLKMYCCGFPECKEQKRNGFETQNKIKQHYRKFHKVYNEQLSSAPAFIICDALDPTVISSKRLRASRKDKQQKPKRQKKNKNGSEEEEEEEHVSQGQEQGQQDEQAEEQNSSAIVIIPTPVPPVYDELISKVASLVHDVENYDKLRQEANNLVRELSLDNGTASEIRTKSFLSLQAYEDEIKREHQKNDILISEYVERFGELSESDKDILATYRTINLQKIAMKEKCFQEICLAELQVACNFLNKPEYVALKVVDSVLSSESVANYNVMESSDSSENDDV